MITLKLCLWGFFLSGTECSVEGKPHVEWSQTGCEGDSTETGCNPKQSL